MQEILVDVLPHPLGSAVESNTPDTFNAEGLLEDLQVSEGSTDSFVSIGAETLAKVEELDNVDRITFEETLSSEETLLEGETTVIAVAAEEEASLTESRLLNSEFPLELIIEVSKSLDIKGKLALRATCKAINNFLTDTRLGLKFVSSHRPISEPPYPHLLLAVTAGQLADWAVKSSRNELLLRGAMKESGDFVELALRVVRVTFGDWIKMQEMRATILRPLAQIVPQKPEAEAWNLKYGRNWYSSFWQEMALTKYLIYCGLFHHSFDNLLNDNAPGPLSIETRNAFFRWLNDEDDVYGSHFLNVLTCDTFKKVLDFLPNLESVESKGVQRLRCILLTHSGENWLRLVTLSIDPESEDWREGRCYIDVQPIHNIESEQWIKDLYAKVLAKIAIGGDLTLNWEKWELETVIQSRREWEGTTRSKQMSRWRLMCKVKV